MQKEESEQNFVETLTHVLLRPDGTKVGKSWVFLFLCCASLLTTALE